MNFKKYLKEREEMFNGIPLDLEKDGEIEEELEKPSNPFGNYLNEELKSSLGALGKDLIEAIYKYATEEYVSEDDFTSEDEQIKYNNTIRNKVSESYGDSLTELLRNIAIFIMNTKSSMTK